MNLSTESPPLIPQMLRTRLTMYEHQHGKPMSTAVHHLSLDIKIL